MAPDRVAFRDVEFAISDNVADYSRVIGSIREELCEISRVARGNRIGGDLPPDNLPACLPAPPNAGDVNYFIRLRLLLPEENGGGSCVLFFGATDLYLVGYQTGNGELIELKPDLEKKSVITEKFRLPANREVKVPKGKKKIRSLGFTESYGCLVRISLYEGKRDVPLCFDPLVAAAHMLSTPFEHVHRKKAIAESMIAGSLLTMVIMFPEAIRVRAIQRFIQEKYSSWKLTGDDVDNWTNCWDKVSKVIKTRALGKNPRLCELRLFKDISKRDKLQTVEDAISAIAIMPCG